MRAELESFWSDYEFTTPMNQDENHNKKKNPFQISKDLPPKSVHMSCFLLTFATILLFSLPCIA